MSEWVVIEAERVLYVDRGVKTILCDRGSPGPVTLLIKVQEHAMKENETEFSDLDSIHVRILNGVRTSYAWNWRSDYVEDLARRGLVKIEHGGSNWSLTGDGQRAIRKTADRVAISSGQRHE